MGEKCDETEQISVQLCLQTDERKSEHSHQANWYSQVLSVSDIGVVIEVAWCSFFLLSPAESNENGKNLLRPLLVHAVLNLNII